MPVAIRRRMDVPLPETSSLSPESNVSNHADSTSPSNIGDHVFDILLVSQARERHRSLWIVSSRVGQKGRQIFHPNPTRVGKRGMAGVAPSLEDQLARRRVCGPRQAHFSRCRDKYHPSRNQDRLCVLVQFIPERPALEPRLQEKLACGC